jgi:hypothetical protein
LADNVTIDGKTYAFKDLAGVFYAWNLLADAAGTDAMGLVATNPNANTLLGRLKAIQDNTDGLEGFVDGLETLLGQATPAGENYIGKNGGDVLVTSVTPVVSTTAYATGDVIGSKLTLANAARIAGGAGIIQSVTLHCKSAQTGAVDLLLFAADPSASTFTDNGALAVNAADFDKLIGVVHITDWTSLGAAISIAQAQAIGMPFDLPAGTSLYAVMVARSTPTLASTSDLKLVVNVLPG